MAEELGVKVIPRHNTEVNWKTSAVVPELGELIVYDPDPDCPQARVKIGNGKDEVSALPFVVPEAQASPLPEADDEGYIILEGGTL